MRTAAFDRGYFLPGDGFDWAHATDAVSAGARARAARTIAPIHVTENRLQIGSGQLHLPADITMLFHAHHPLPWMDGYGAFVWVRTRCTSPVWSSSALLQVDDTPDIGT